MVVFKINVNACILTHPINNYNLGEGGGVIGVPYFIYTAMFFPYTPSNQLFSLYPKFLFSCSPIVVHFFFLHLILFLTLYFFALCKRFKHSAEIFPPNMWVEVINSTLV